MCQRQTSRGFPSYITTQPLYRFPIREALQRLENHHRPNHSQQVHPPEGRFTMLVGGYEHSCGLRTDGTVACWGRLWTLPSPAGVQEVWSSGDSPATPGERS